MKAWSWQSFAIIVLIAALLPVLAFLQFYWLDELARLEQEHRSANLRAAAVRFSVDFDAQLAGLYQSFHVPEAELGEPAKSMAADFREWAELADHPELVESVYWVEVFEDDGPRVRKLDIEDERLVDVAWPTPLDGLQEAFAAPGTVDPLQATIPALVVFQHETETSLPWAVVVLDKDVISGPFLSERVAQFSGGSPIDFDAVIVDNRVRDHVVFSSDPALSAANMSESDDTASMGFFGLHTRDFRFDWIEALPTGATEHQGRLMIRHQPGALAAAVGALRARNVAISLGILLLLAGSILVLLVSTRKAQRWARLELDYVARIAHEIRTPLAVIGFASENLADESVVPDLDKARTYGQVINKESRRLTKLVESALLHTRLESGVSAEIEREPVRIADVIDAALGESEIDGVRIHKHIADGLPSVMGDGEALQSALQNLLSNALKYGGATRELSVSARKRPDANGSAIEIEIEDQGPGIPASDLPHIFEPFYRGRVARDEQIEGSGIGLSLVKHVVDAHGGSIRVSSPQAGGSRFTVLLPAGA